MVQESSLSYLISGLKEGLRALVKESNQTNTEKVTSSVSENKKDDWEEQCNKKDCLDARLKLNSVRSKVLEACYQYKNLEGERNIHAGAATAAIVASLAFMYKVVLLGSISNLWIVAAGIAIALAINDSKSLISTQKKLKSLNQLYLNYLEDFKTTLKIVHENCDPDCLLVIDTSIPICE